MKIFFQFENEKGRKCGRLNEEKFSQFFHLASIYLVLEWKMRIAIWQSEIWNVKCYCLIVFLKFHEQRRVTMKFHIVKCRNFHSLENNNEIHDGIQESFTSSRRLFVSQQEFEVYSGGDVWKFGTHKRTESSQGQQSSCLHRTSEAFRELIEA